MKRYIPVVIVALVILAVIWKGRQPVPNPDPNHTHADFAVWVEGKKLDFSDPAFMSGLSTDDTTHDEAGEYHHQYLHLHDENGHVIHSHKPGQTLGEFFRSLGVVDTRNGINLCLQFPQLERKICEDEAGHRTWQMELDGDHRSIEPLDFTYVFKDGDTILITLPSTSDEGDQQREIDVYWQQMTDDACMYSKTCPWRGEPPTENCIADPSVPCVAL